jgi:protein-S-isoprenylcysteine O-methyltransferase Ste14
MWDNYFFWFGICFVCYIVRTVFNVFIYRRSPIAENRKILNFIFVIMGILWFSWHYMCFIDPIEFNIPPFFRYIGLLLFIIGISLFILSHTKLGGFEDKGGLITGGIYSKISNPMYLGFMIWIIGFPIFTKSLITLISSPIWISLIIYWKILEEKKLEEKYYKEYKNYKKNTWF